jgi:hypothetical protein
MSPSIRGFYCHLFGLTDGTICPVNSVIEVCANIATAVENVYSVSAEHTAQF